MLRNLTLGYMPGGTGRVQPFDLIYKNAQNIMKDGAQGCDAIVVWGGRDINPSLYGHSAHPNNQAAGDVGLSAQDKAEWGAMTWAKANNIPIIGVCRGAQMACAFAGGSLIQDVDHHSGDHKVVCHTPDGLKTMVTNSVHHQMMYPFDVEHKLLAWTPRRSTVYHGERDDSFADLMKGKDEPEVVYFPAVRALAIQGHPEWLDESSEFVKWCLSQVETYLLEEEIIHV